MYDANGVCFISDTARRFSRTSSDSLAEQLPNILNPLHLLLLIAHHAQ